jgi:hypothetical protein
MSSNVPTMKGLDFPRLNFKDFPFHSFLVGVYPILYLFARNIVFIPFVDTIRTLAITFGLTLLFLVGFRVILKNWAKAGILCTMLLIFFFSFGHIAILLQTWSTDHGWSVNVSILAITWLLIFLILFFIVMRTKVTEKTTQVLNFISLILVLFPLTTIITTSIDRIRSNQFEKNALAEMRGEQEAEASMVELPESEKPDIYFIILDAYERADILDELYDYDNSPFMNALQDRGFYNVNSSRSNFLSTTYSLNTSLNLLYINDFPTPLFKQARYNLYTNYVNDFLRDQGYEIVVFDSGTGDSNYQYADLFLSPPSIQQEEPLVSPFEQLLIRTTLGWVFINSASSTTSPVNENDVFNSSVNRELEVRRERIRYTLDHLPDYAAEDRPHFVFAHIYLPHYPFLYGPDGEDLVYDEEVNLFWYEVDPKDYIEYYTYQIDYLNQVVLQAIDRILASSDKPVVIVLQSDHGDEKYLDWDSPTAQGVGARSANLNSIYFSDGDYENLYPTMTSVNTFRVILDHWFGTEYPLLPDKVFFHEHPVLTPFNVKPEFIEGCPRFDICLPPLLN